ncbi:MAG: hypothetical protein NXI31_09155 [bacterium]|nr:hypothetical protein [bacterium]
MIRNALLPLAALAALTPTLAAQQFCTDNQYKLYLTDADGNPAPTFFDPVTNETTFQFDNEQVYLAFDPSLPSGTYYVHVTDPINFLGDVVLSTNDPMDRFVQVDNNNGEIAISLPFSSGTTPVLGKGLNGVGESLLLQPFTTNPNEPCRFKAWFGDAWDLTNGPNNPYLLAGGLHPTTGLCAVRSYEAFRIGDGTGTDVSGSVFVDTDRDGERDPGEVGAAGYEVHLVSPTGSISTTTDNDGNYRFVDVVKDDYNVEITVPSTHIATTASSFEIEVCGCADVAVSEFGVATAMLACEAKSCRYWRHWRGLRKVRDLNLLPTLPALGIVDACGRRVAPANLCQLRRWMRCCWSWNMAYSLSIQLATMHFNVQAGYVDVNCVINDPCLGVMTIDQLMQQATMSIWAHPYTGWCSPHRHDQAKLRNALSRANRNRIWM